MEAKKARLEDIEILVELRLAYLTEDHGGLSGQEAGAIRRQLPGYFEAHLGKDLFCYLLRDGENVAACAFLLVTEKPMSPAFINGKTGTVLNVYTRPAFRRRGYGKAVMQALMADARAKELCVVELKATDAGYPLYQALGFADDGGKYRPMHWEIALGR